MIGGCGTGEPALVYDDPSDGFVAADTAAPSPDVTQDVGADPTPPQLAITAPSTGTVVEQEIVVVEGSASDASGIAEVRVRVDEGPWLKAELGAQSGDPWRAWLSVPPGDHTLHAVAEDKAGNTAAASITVHRVRTLTLEARLPAKAAAPVTLSLDKAAVKALIPEQAAKDLVIYLLDVRPLLTVALEAFKAPTVWGLDTSPWGKAEWNMHKVLTMTPDTADLTGTAAAPLMGLATNLGMAVPLVLADVAGISPTAAFLSTDQVAQAMYRNVVASHPALVVDPDDGVKKIPITLYDALVDLTTLDTKLGPQGGHPGVVYDATPTPVMLPDFRITLTGRSNLREFEGVDLSGGMRWLFLKAKGDDVVTFDFLDPEAFTLTGLASEPLVDLFVLTTEHKGYIDTAYSKTAGADGPYFKGASKAWTLPKWTSEHLVIDAVYHAYRERFSESNYQGTASYDVGDLKKAATWTWDKGWLAMTTVAGIGSPPSPTYWWDLVLELAQQRLHDGGIAEGKANLHLPITGIPVPITAEALVAKARKLFEQQKSALAAASVGDHSTYDSTCDLFALQSPSGGVALLFVAAADLPGHAGPTHAKPGLFSDAALSQKISTTDDLGFGDTAHEKLALAEGQGVTAYAADLDGSVWRLDLLRTGTRVQVTLRPQSAAGKGAK